MRRRRRTKAKVQRVRIRHRRRRRVRRNPTLATLALANPRRRVVKRLSNRAYLVAYKHTEDGEDYQHDFGPGVRVDLLSDGSVHLWHPSHPIWTRMAA